MTVRVSPVLLTHIQHSVTTMWRVYSAWLDGAIETDIEAIRRAMQHAAPARSVLFD